MRMAAAPLQWMEDLFALLMDRAGQPKCIDPGVVCLCLWPSGPLGPAPQLFSWLWSTSRGESWRLPWPLLRFGLLLSPCLLFARTPLGSGSLVSPGWPGAGRQGHRASDEMQTGAGGQQACMMHFAAALREGAD